MSFLSESLDHLTNLIETPSFTIPAVQQSVYHIVEQAKRATPQEKETALQRLSTLVSHIPLLPAAVIAIGCGALIEQGVDTAIAGPAILQRTQEALELAPAFVVACQNEAREHPGMGAPEDNEACIEQFGRQMASQMPAEGQAWLALKPLCTAALAVLMRLPAMREIVRHDTGFQVALATSSLDGPEVTCVREVLQVLEHEELVVLHPALKRGYRIRIAGIGRNFELHTLLADALIGDPAQGWLPGQRPDPRVVAAAKDGPFPLPGEDARDFPYAFGAFNLWNWHGLQPDGTLPEGQWKQEHWIWNEGKPADIAPFEGTRVILLGPSPYQRSWNAGRYFPCMTGEVEVLEQLPPAQVEEWLARIKATVTR